MKKQILTLIIGIISINVFAQIPTNVPTNGLVGYWPFNGNANDESGNGNNGVVTGAVLTSDRGGFNNKSYLFDGSGDFIDCGNSSAFNITQSITISAWVNASNLNSDHGIISKMNLGNATYELITSSNQIRWMDAGGFLFSNAITANEWMHIVAVFDFVNQKKEIYLNGLLFASSNVTLSSIPTNNDHLFIGAHQPSNVSSWSWSGKLDDIGIWNRVLTSQEILNLYGCSNLISTITPQKTTTFCIGDSVTLNANIVIGGSYQWFKNNQQIVNETNNYYVAKQAGSYMVKISDNLLCNTKSSSINITVNPLPSVSLASVTSLLHTKANPVTLVGNPSGGVYSGPGVSGNVLTPLNAGLGLKTVTYSYTNLNNCTNSVIRNTIIYDTVTCSTFDTLFINVAVAGINAPNNIGTLKIWPNPANDHIIIDNGNIALLSGYKVKIESILGQEVFKSSINQQQFSVDLSTWNGKGIYLVHIIDNQDNIIETKKIVIQ